MEDLTNTDDQIAVIDDNQIKQFQSLYYLIKGKRDTDIKLYNDYKQFNFTDIVELNQRVYKKLELHHLVTDIVNVTVGLDNKEIKVFGSWHEFENTNWNISATTKYITIEWDFNLILPNQFHKVPQTHTLRVRIGNNLKPSEMIQVVFQGDDEYDLEEAQSQMSCKIDFINSQICNELKIVVSDWYDALPKNSEDQKFIKTIIRHESKLQSLVLFSFISASVILMNFLFNIAVKNDLSFLPKDNIQKLFLFLTLSIACFYLFYQMGKILVGRMVNNQINKLKRNPMFEFTKGDRNKLIDIKNANKKHLKGIAITIIIGLATNGISALIGFLLEKFI